MSRLLSAVVLLFLALLELMGWSGQRTRAERQAAELAAAAPTVRALPAHRWARSHLGGPPRPLALLELEDSLRRWRLDPPELEGYELLVPGPAGDAARLLLDRWLELSPGSGGRALRLGLGRPDPDGPLQLEVELEGPPGAVLPWVRSLLAQPRGDGVLADPRRLDLRAEGERLHAALELRAWPTDALLEDRD